MPAGKTARKKLQNKSSTQVAATQSVHDVTVRDCLMWSDDQKKQTTAVNQDDVVYVSLRKQQQQQSKSSTEMNQMRAPAPPQDDATVGDALRGWPRYMKQYVEQMQQETQEDAQKQPTTKTKSGQTTKAGMNKTKSNEKKEKDEDIHVADLISQRFLHEFQEQRQAEMEREQRKKEARERAAREGRRAAKDRTDIKANKAAQLRAIALADRVDVSPFDLWKMEKFTRSARPHVSSFRNGQGPSGSSANGVGGAGRGRRGGSRGGGYNGSGRDGFSGRSSGSQDYDEFSEMVGACTCPDKLPYYDGREVYDMYDVCDDGCMITDQCDDNADCVYDYVMSSSISAL